MPFQRSSKPSSSQPSLSTVSPDWTKRLAPGALFRRISLAPQTQSMLCLPSGHALLCIGGRIEVQAGPRPIGDVMVNSSTQRLEEGSVMACEPHGQTLWLNIRVPGQAGAEIALIQPVPAARFAAVMNGMHKLIAWTGLKRGQAV